MSLDQTVHREKCENFCCHYLIQVLKYFSDSVLITLPSFLSSSLLIDTTVNVTQTPSNQQLSQTSNKEDDLLDKTLDITNSHLSQITKFINDLLDIFYKSIDFNKFKNTSLTDNSYNNTNNNQETNTDSNFSNTNNTNNSNDNTNINSCVNSLFKRKNEIIWILFKLISIYFDNNELADRYDLSLRPVKCFMIVYDLIIAKNNNNSNEENVLEGRVEYLSIVHEYLSRNYQCGANEGEFLSWMIKCLFDAKSKCDICMNNHQNQENKSNLNKCICNEIDKILDQCFFCLYGYKKRTLRYLENHVVSKIQSTLETSVDLYNFYKPTKLPEYDDLPKYSVPAEFNDLLLEIVKLIHQKKFGNDEEQDEAFELIKDQFLIAFETENYDELDDYLSIYTDHDDLESSVFRDVYFLIGDYYFKFEKNFDKKDS
jgi:hypothetical protein